MSKRFKEGRTGTEKLPIPDSHVDGENSTKTIVYNTKRYSKKKEFQIIDQTIRTYPRMLFVSVHE